MKPYDYRRCHNELEKFSGKDLGHYINPWNFGGDSNYTAGFLTIIFAKILSDVDTNGLEEASLMGDYSVYSKPDAASRRIAALLDLVTSDTSVLSGTRGNLTPEDIDKLFSDKGKSEELIAYAEHRVSEMLDTGINSVKVHAANGFNIYVADFESIRGSELERYPLPGRFASRLLGRIEELNKVPCVLLLHFGHFISARMSKELIGRVDLIKALESARENYPAYFDSSGGHSNAASLKLKSDEMKKEIIKSVIDKLKAASSGK